MAVRGKPRIATDFEELDPEVAPSIEADRPKGPPPLVLPVGASVASSPSRPVSRTRPLTDPSPDESSFRSGNLWLGLGATLAVVIAIAVVISRPASEDGNLVKAKGILEVYEHARPETERNYQNPIYHEALASLDQVSPGSASADEAQQLATNLRKRMEDFSRRSALSGQQIEAAVEEREKRKEEFFDAQRRVAQAPAPTYPECERENTRKGRAVQHTSR